MRRFPPAALLAAALALSGVVSACPTCAGPASPTARSVWPLVGVFLLVPPLIATAVILLMRREMRAPLGEAAPFGRLLPFNPRRG